MRTVELQVKVLGQTLRFKVPVETLQQREKALEAELKRTRELITHAK